MLERCREREREECQCVYVFDGERKKGDSMSVMKKERENVCVQTAYVSK